MKTRLISRLTWSLVIGMGALVLCPAEVLNRYFIQLGCGVLAIGAGLFGLVYSFRRMGFDTEYEPPSAAMIVDIMAATALILYGLFLALPAGLLALNNNQAFRVISGTVAIGIGGCGWVIDWYSSGERKDLLLIGLLVESAIECLIDYLGTGAV